MKNFAGVIINKVYNNTNYLVGIHSAVQDCESEKAIKNLVDSMNYCVEVLDTINHGNYIVRVASVNDTYQVIVTSDFREVSSIVVGIKSALDILCIPSEVLELGYSVGKLTVHITD